MNLIDQMKFSADTMTLGDKLLGSMVITLLGVGIVFVALIILFFATVTIQKVINKPEPEKVEKPKPDPVDTEEVEENNEEDSVEDTELVAVITAAVAASMNTSTHNIVVRNITRVGDTTPAWAKAGRIDQINGR